LGNSIIVSNYTAVLQLNYIRSPVISRDFCTITTKAHSFLQRLIMPLAMQKNMVWWIQRWIHHNGWTGTYV